MEMNKQGKFAVLAISILVVLNLILIGLILLPKGVHDSGNTVDRRGKLTDAISKKLSFTPEQKLQLEVLDTSHRNKMGQQLSILSQKRKKLFELIRAEGDHTEDVQRISQEMGEVVSRLESSNFLYFSQIRGLCTEEQKFGFDEFLQELGSRRGGFPESPGSGSRRGFRDGGRPEGPPPEN